jgi:hypothetical protein
VEGRTRTEIHGRKPFWAEEREERRFIYNGYLVSLNLLGEEKIILFASFVRQVRLIIKWVE